MTSDGQVIRVPPAELRELAAALTARAEEAGEAAAGLRGGPDPGPALGLAVADLLLCHRTAAQALAGELGWLGGAVTAVAASWESLDSGLLGRRGPV